MFDIKLKGKRIDLGGGEFPKEGFVNIDKYTKNPINGHSYTPDIQHDLNEGIPFPDNFIDEIYTSHFIEHVVNPVFLMDEIWRVCKNGSKVQIICPVHDMVPGHLTDMSFKWFENNVSKDKFEFVSHDEHFKPVIDPVYGNRTFVELNVVLRVRK
jgi:predicted SAM-dependent methyltransferase